jgi:hypothetical protein
MLPNPFFYGNPVSYSNFIGRGRELRRIVGRLFKAESTAIIGDPHIGKTSLLNYLVDPQTRVNLYGSSADQWHFSQIDVHLLSTGFTSGEFWEQALAPVKKHTDQHADSLLAKHYEICRENGFGNFTLERLFSQLKKTNRRFILMLDEFDSLLHHPVLNSAEFYGGLRSLASRSGAFALIIASRAPLSQLNTITQEFNPTGSPFFNIFAEITLGPLADSDVNQLLSRSDPRFADHDRDAIRALGGRHPYLLQAAAYAMWDAYEDGELNRRPYITRRLYRELAHFFADTWGTWPPGLRKAFTAVAIAHQSYLLEKQFLTSKFIEEFTRWKPELDELEEKGWILKAERFKGGYGVSPEIMLTWTEDELIKVGREETPFERWIQDKQMDGAFLTVSEKKAFKKAVENAGGLLSKGAASVVEILSKELLT